jgi:hypothetical protein
MIGSIVNEVRVDSNKLSFDKIIAKQNSARLELQKQQQEQKNRQKALKSAQSSNRLSSSGSQNTKSDANKDFAYQIVNNVEREGRKMSLKRKTKDDYSDDSLFENIKSQKLTDKSKKLIKKNQPKTSTLISSVEEDNDDNEEKKKRPQVALDLPPKSANEIKPAKIGDDLMHLDNESEANVEKSVDLSPVGFSLKSFLIYLFLNLNIPYF